MCWWVITFFVIFAVFVYKPQFFTFISYNVALCWSFMLTWHFVFYSFSEELVRLFRWQAPYTCFAALKGPFIATQLNSTQLNSTEPNSGLKGPFIATQLNSTSSCRHVHSVNNCHLSMNVVTQLTQFVGPDVINKNITDLAVRCSTGSVEFSWVELCRYKRAFSSFTITGITPYGQNISSMMQSDARFSVRHTS